MHTAILCYICFDEYNTTDHLPIMLPCGHTLCYECLKAILTQRLSECPLDKKKFPSRDIASFPINFTLRDQIEENNKWQICRGHGKRIEVACFTDKCEICEDCAIFGGHLKHLVKPLATARLEIESRKLELEQAIKNLNNFEKNIKEAILETEICLCKIITSQLTQNHMLLKQRSRYFFKQLRTEIEQNLSAFISKIALQIESCKEGLETRNIFAVPYEELSHLIKSYNQSDWNITEIKSKFEGAINTFKKLLNKNIDILIEFNTLIKNLCKTLNGLLIGNDENIMFLQNDISLSLEISSSININKNKEYLEIFLSNKEPENIILDSQNWEAIKKVKVIIGKGSFTEEDLDIINYIFTRIQNIDCVQIIANYLSNIDNRSLNDLFSVLSGNFEALKEVEINFGGSKITDSIFISLADKFISNTLNLETIKLYLFRTHITDQAIQHFAKKILPEVKYLQHLTIGLGYTDTSNISLIELSTNMENLITFELGLSYTKINDQGLEKWVVQTLPLMTHLKKLSIKLWNTNITDEGVNKLVSNITRDLKEFDLSLGNTSITDNAVQFFVNNIFPYMKSLENFNIDLYGTQVTEKAIMLLQNTKKR